MKASVQYNDFIGTAAADINDWIRLDEYLKQKGVDTERYEPIGAEFYHGERYFGASIICKDKQSENPNKAVKISFEKGLSKEEFFNLFKIFNVIITKKYGEYQNWELDEDTILIDDRN